MNKNKKYNNLFVFFIVLLIIILFNYKCPFDYIIGIPCPFCGMTRAIINAFMFNFKDAFYYHALWPFIFLLPIYFILKYKNIKNSKRIENLVCIIIGAIFLLYFIIRHYYSSPIVELHFQDSLIYKLYQLLF